MLIRRSNPSPARARPRLAALAGGALLLLALPLRGEVILEESFALAAGWNYIRISVEPAETRPAVALSSVDWVSLWTLLPGATDGEPDRWLSFHRDAPEGLNSLRSFSGPGAYALRLRAGGTLRVRGAFRAEPRALRSGLQLFGPAVSVESPPTLVAYFSRPGVREQLAGVFEHRDGAYRRVGDQETLRPGAAYFVVAKQDVPAPDPLRVAAGFGGVRFDAQAALSEFELDLCAAVEPREFRLRALPSLGGAADSDWLEVLAADGSFVPLGAGAEATLEVPPGTTRVRVVVRARREGVATASAAEHSALIEIGAPEGTAAMAATLDAPTLQGIWVGEATISAVERMSLYGSGFAPSATVRTSLIFEVPLTGRPRLLPCLEVESSRDGRTVARRLEAALLSEVAELSGTIGAEGSTGTLSSTIALGADHPLNPYRHRYHPEHGLGYDIARFVRLRFGAEVPAPELENPLATVGVLSGVYEEEITGLTQEPIRLRGSFRLRRFAGGAATPCQDAGE